MTFPRRHRPGRSLLASALLTAALTPCLWAGVRADRALAEACPGSGAGQCPYAAARIIGQRAESVLRFPEAIAVAGSASAGGGQGPVYVADQLGYVVQKFTAAGAFETEWGSYGGGQGQFGPIGGLATDAAGNVYVVDSSHNRIEKFDANGTFITAWGHRGSELGQFSFGSSEDYTKPPGGGIAVAGTYVYVADSGNNRIERFALDGSEAMQWGTKGSEPGQFSYPRGIAADASEVLVADDDNHRIEKFDPHGAFQSSAGSQGTGAGQYGFPYGITLDAAGNAYVADDINHRVVKLTPELAFARAWGGLGSKPGQLGFPRALASDPAGDTYVADTANDRIQVFNPEGRYLRTFGASGRALGVLTAPRGLAADPTGGLLVSDTVDNRVELFSAGSDAFAGAWTRAGGHRPSFSKPAGIAVDPRGPVYIADQGNARIGHLWGDGTFLSELGGPAEIGGAQLSGAGSVAVAADSGRIYVADANHNRLLVYGREGSLIAKWGAGGGNGAPGSEAGEFDHPAAVAVASTAAGGEGNLYVADRGNDRIVELSPEGGVLRQWGSTGASDGSFRGPSGVALDGAGMVYVLDGENNRVEVFDSAGRFVEKWGLRGIGLGEFSKPSAIAVDCAGAVYVADTNNNRVERFDPVSPAPAGCIAQSAWPPPLDVAPMLRVSLARHAGVLARRALALTVSCERGCKVLATATLSPRGRRGAVRLIAAARSLPRVLAGHVRLRVAAAALRRLRKALGRRAALRANVSIIAAGPTGRRTTVTRTYVVER
jgi:tripartite motif-containing protein 71